MTFPDQATFLRQSRETLTQIRATISSILDLIEQGRYATGRSRMTVERAKAVAYTALEIPHSPGTPDHADRLALTPQRGPRPRRGFR
jgi:hypothetical protein